MLFNYGAIKKTFTCGGGAEVVVQESNKMYLLKDSQVAVGYSMVGRCKVSYAAKTELVAMWAKCNSIAFSTR